MFRGDDARAAAILSPRFKFALLWRPMEMNPFSSGRIRYTPAPYAGSTTTFVFTGVRS